MSPNESTVFVSTRAFPGGSIQPSEQTEVSYGGSLTLSVTPSSGYRIQRVTVNGQAQTGSLSSVSLTNITQVQYVRAYFELIPQTFSVTPTAGSGGSIAPSEVQTVESGKPASFNIQPDSGYRVQDVKVNGRSVGAVETYRFGVKEINSDQTIDAQFELLPANFTITPSAGANGSVSPSTAMTVEEGSGTPFTFTPNSGYVIDDVLVDGKSVGAVEYYNFSNVDHDQSVSVIFKKVDESPTNEELDDDIEELDKKVEAIEAERKAEEATEKADEEEEKQLEPWAETLEKWGGYTAAVECRLKGLITITEKLYSETLELDHEIINTMNDLEELRFTMMDTWVAATFGEENLDAQLEELKTEIETGEEQLEKTTNQIRKVAVGVGMVAIATVGAVAATAGLMASSDSK